MGIRYEKDTILNWINEMGKFLRLLIDKWETNIQNNEINIPLAYETFFKNTRSNFLSYTEKEINDFATEQLLEEQIRPLALLMMYDGLLSQDENEKRNLLTKAKFLLNKISTETKSFSFEDFNHLKTIGDHIE